jgi:hypothetical protein
MKRRFFFHGLHGFKGFHGWGKLPARKILQGKQEAHGWARMGILISVKIRVIRGKKSF